MTAMKKSIASFLCICLTLSMLLVCAGCKSGGDADKFVGDWEAKVDMTDMLNDMLASDPSTADLAGYIKIDSYVLTLNFSFTSDGKYSIKIDRDALQKTSDALLSTMKTGILAYFEDMLEEMAAEYDVTVDEFLEVNEVASIEEFLIANDVDIDNMFDVNQLTSAFDAVESSGTYKAKDGELRLTNNSDNTVDIEIYEFTSDTQVSLVDQTEDSELGDIVLNKK